MDIFKLNRYFWDFVFSNPEKIKPNDIAIYSFAIEHCNRLGWKQKFGFPTTMVMEAVGIKSYSVYKKHFDNLVDNGFFTVIEYSKNQYSANIIALKENYKAYDKALDKAMLKHTSKHLSKQDESTYESTYESNCSIDIHNTNIHNTNLPNTNTHSDDVCLEKINESIFLILKFFGFNENVNHDKVRKCNEFLKCIQINGRLEYFNSQFESYISYKELSKEKLHGFEKFLGNQENLYEDGGWNSENWLHKLIELRKSLKNGKSTQQSIDEKQQGRDKLSQSAEDVLAAIAAKHGY